MGQTSVSNKMSGHHLAECPKKWSFRGGTIPQVHDEESIMIDNNNNNFYTKILPRQPYDNNAIKRNTTKTAASVCIKFDTKRNDVYNQGPIKKKSP